MLLFFKYRYANRHISFYEIPNILLKLVNIEVSNCLFCFLCPASGDLFSGDTLFAGSIGRSDLPGGDYDKEIASITVKLIGLDSDTSVHPGHGWDTTIGEERARNPFLSNG